MRDRDRDSGGYSNACSLRKHAKALRNAFAAPAPARRERRPAPGANRNSVGSLCHAAVNIARFADSTRPTRPALLSSPRPVTNLTPPTNGPQNWRRDSEIFRMAFAARSALIVFASKTQTNSGFDVNLDDVALKQE
jgi:hypothetical protein